MQRLHRHGFFLLVFISILQPCKVMADEGFYLGATVSGGIIYAENGHEHIALKREIIELQQRSEMRMADYTNIPIYDYKVLFEFQNTANETATVPCAFPIEFRHDVGMGFIANELTIELFQLFKGELTLDESQNRSWADKVKAELEGEKPIRKMVTLEELSSLGIIFKVFQDGKSIDIQQVLAEISLEENTQNKWQSQILVRFHLMHELSFKEFETSMVKVEYSVPGVHFGYDDSKYYSPYVLWTGRTWKGPIDEIHVVFPEGVVGLATFPMETHEQSIGWDRHAVSIFTHEPAEDEILVFYDHSATCGCIRDDILADKTWQRNSMKNLQTSSFLSGSKTVSKKCVLGYRPAVKVDRTLLKNYATDPFFEHKEINGAHIAPARLKNDCEEETAIVQYKDYYGIEQMIDRGISKSYHESTAWCEGENGNGELVTVTFEIDADAKRIRINNGYQKNTDIFQKNGRVKKLFLKNTSTEETHYLDLADKSGPQEFYASLKKGKYILTILEVFPGEKFEDTCLSNLNFYFLPGGWLGKNYPF